MKTKIFTIALLLIGQLIIAQDTKQTRIPTLGEYAPAFDAESTKGTIKFPDNYYGKWRIILSHPAGFTPVCTSEIIELANMQEDFRKLKTEILVVSTDGINSNLEWIKSMEVMEYKDKKTLKINFPIISDLGFDISKKYGMQHLNSNSTKNIRGVFIIDPENKIRIIMFYPNNIGRNMEEIKRTLIALQESEKENVLTPANWKPGDDYLLAPPANLEEFEKIKDKRKDNQYYLAWYMWFKKG